MKKLKNKILIGCACMLASSFTGCAPQKQDQKDDKKDQNKNQQEQDKKDQQNQNQQQQQQNKDEMSKENAQQLLNAVMQDEKNVQDKVKKQLQIQGKKLDKDW